MVRKRYREGRQWMRALFNSVSDGGMREKGGSEIKSMELKKEMRKQVISPRPSSSTAHVLALIKQKTMTTWEKGGYEIKTWSEKGKEEKHFSSVFFTGSCTNSNKTEDNDDVAYRICAALITCSLCNDAVRNSNQTGRND
jgi:hypothetical protein